MVDAMTNTTSLSTTTPEPPDHPIGGVQHTRRVASVLASKSFATLATVSESGFPHSAGVVYVWVEGSMWIHTMRSSRKGRNIAHEPRVAITVPYRRLPAGPPFTLHFQARAVLVAMDDPTVRSLLDAGRLKHIAGHGALDEPDGVFVRVTPTATIHSYGPGARTLDLIRNPLHSGAGSAPAVDVMKMAR